MVDTTALSSPPDGSRTFSSPHLPSRSAHRTVTSHRTRLVSPSVIYVLFLFLCRLCVPFFLLLRFTCTQQRQPLFANLDSRSQTGPASSAGCQPIAALSRSPHGPDVSQWRRVPSADMLRDTVSDGGGDRFIQNISQSFKTTLFSRHGRNRTVTSTHSRGGKYHRDDWFL